MERFKVVDTSEVGNLDSYLCGVATHTDCPTQIVVTLIEN